VLSLASPVPSRRLRWWTPGSFAEPPWLAANRLAAGARGTGWQDPRHPGCRNGVRLCCGFPGCRTALQPPYADFSTWAPPWWVSPSHPPRCEISRCGWC